MGKTQAAYVCHEATQATTAKKMMIVASQTRLLMHLKFLGCFAFRLF